MPGVRIHHATEINCVYTLMDGNRPYTQPVECGQCHLTHNFKTYHINLDGEGFAIVSPEVWDYLQRIPAQPFTLMNEVEKPPPIPLKVGFQGSAKIIGVDGKEIRSGES